MKDMDHYKAIMARVADDVDMPYDVIDTITKCVFYELAEELVVRHTVELPYVGDISYKRKSFRPNAIMNNLARRGGSHAIKFRRTHDSGIKRSSGRKPADSGSVRGPTVSDGVSQNDETNKSGEVS